LIVEKCLVCVFVANTIRHRRSKAFVTHLWKLNFHFIIPSFIIYLWKENFR